MSDNDEIKSIVLQSGNSFHCRVVNHLKNKGWYTLISPYYMDNGTSKPREIDLIAEKAWPHKYDFSQKCNGTINVKLFIECKYIPQNNVFWFCDKDLSSAKEWVTTNTPLRADNSFIDKHHYLSTNSKVAKLFAGKNKPNIENEVIYKALNQSLNAMIYLRGRESIIPRNPKFEHILKSVEMPVILCNSFDKFYRVEMSETTEPVKIDDNFQLEVNYAYIDTAGSHRSEYFLLDIVDFNRLDNFLSIIETDVNAIHQVV